MKRKLAAVLHADVVGYSRLIGADEEKTLTALDASREVFKDRIVGQGGRVIDMAGDSVLAVFPAATAAIKAAREIQIGLSQLVLPMPGEQRMRFRIGIDLGEVIEKTDGSVYGEGVNIAVRLENLVEPGGICVSDRVLEQVQGKLDLGFACLGARSVKNIRKPVTAYKVLLDPQDAGKIVNDTKTSVPFRRWSTVIIVAFICAAAAIGFFFYQQKPEFEPASVERMAYPLPDRPSVAVLPFENYSVDAKLDFFASGLTEDLTAALSKATGLFVIARNSAATYKGKPVDVKRVAEEQGVQYVLEGSVQKSGDRLRITAQLVDALTGRHLWANRFDRQAKDVFAIQDEIVKNVMVELQVELTQGDAERVASLGTDNLEAWLLRTEAYGEAVKFSREGMIRARELYEAAHQADPSWSRPVSALGMIDWYEAKQGWSPSREASIQSGMELAQRAIQMNPDDPHGYMILGNLYALQGQADRMIEFRRKAAEMAPNDFNVIAGLATRLKDFGGEQEAVVLFERAMRLSPKHPWYVQYGYALSLHLLGRKEEAVASFKKTIELNPNHVLPRAFLAAVYVDLGRMDEARAQADEVMRLNPGFNASRLMQSHSLHDPARDARYKDLMVRAGLPE
jgi:adenylate cyclase